MIVDCALYQHGERQPGHVELENACEAAAGEDAFVWIGVNDPSSDEFSAIAREFNLPPLAVEDAMEGHQRPKGETYGETLFVVLKPVRYVDSEELVDVAEVQLFVHERFVITVRHGETAVLGEVRAALEADPAAMARGPIGALHAIVDRVVDDYEDALSGLETDVEEVETEVFGSGHGSPAQRIYRLEREVLQFFRAAVPLAPAVDELATGKSGVTDDELRDLFRDVHDHLMRVQGRLHGLRALLDSALQANLTQITIRQNEDMRKISAWVAIAAVPTAVSAIYGMNFEHMPELKLRYGYPVVLLVMATACLLLYRRFKQVGWL